MASEIPKSLDVSCRATAHVIHWFLLNNKPASCLIEGLPHSLAHLQNASASISWDYYLLFLRNCHDLLTEDEWCEQARCFGESRYLSTMLTFAGQWLFPANCFAWAIGKRGNVVGSIFRCLSPQNLTISRQAGQIEYLLAEPYTLPPNFFWQAMTLGFQGSASVVGLAPIADIHWEPIERGARLTVKFPRPSLLRFLRRRAGSLLNRDSARNKRLREEFFHDREYWLQQEITKRIESEQALRESEAQLRVLMEAAPEAIIVYDLDEDRIISVNRNAEELFCKNESSLLKTSLFDLILLPQSEEHNSLQTRLERTLSGRTEIFEFVYTTPSEIQIPCEARLVRLPSKKKLLVRASIMNIADRVSREELLRNSRQYLQSVLESTSDFVFSLDRSLSYLAFNRNHFEKMKEVYGVEIGLGKRILDYLNVEADHDTFVAGCRRALAGERFQTIQPFGDSRLSRTTLEISFNPIHTEAGEVSGIAVFARDTSDQIRAQNALRESEELQRLAIEVSELGLWRFNTRTREFALDSRAQQLFGFRQRLISENAFESRIHPDDIDSVLSEVKRLYVRDSDGIFKIEHRILLPDGTCRWVTACGTRLLTQSSAGGSGDLEFIGTIMDVSARVQTANMLTASLNEKNAMLKEIHHRVKNNLQVISSLLSLQAFNVKSREVMEFSLESQRRVKAMALVHETLYQTETLAKINMTEYVARLSDNLIQSYGAETATVSCEVDELLLEVEQAVPIGLILSELITNSLKHAFTNCVGKGVILVGLRVHSNESVLLRVSDNGIGLPAIWNSKKQGSLGLTLVQLLTQQLHARMSITSAKGANFEIEIPYAKPT